MNVFHFGDDDAKESAEEKPVTQKSSYNENIIRKSKCNNKHLAVVDDDDDDEDGDNTARGYCWKTCTGPPPNSTALSNFRPVETVQTVFRGYCF